MRVAGPSISGKPFTALVAVVLTTVLAMAASAEPAAQPFDCRAAVVVYHRIGPHIKNETPAQRIVTVDPQTFIGQMQHIFDNGFTVVSYEALVDCIDGKAPIPEKSVVITFDDGHISQYKVAFPILRMFGYTATFFVVTNSVGKRPRLMNWDQLREMRDAGMTIGSHSRRHPVLPTLLDARRLTQELAGSRQDIADQMGAAPDFIAYPYGAWSPRVVREIQKAGYRSARGIRYSSVHRPSDRYLICIMSVGDSLAAFRRRLGRLTPDAG